MRKRNKPTDCTIQAIGKSTDQEIKDVVIEYLTDNGYYLLKETKTTLYYKKEGQE